MDSGPEGGVAPRTASDRPENDLTIGCFAAVCRSGLADGLLAFARAHPAIGIGVREMARPELLPALQQGALSLVVKPGASHPTIPSAHLWMDSVVVAMAPHHRLAGASAVTPTELRGEVFLVPRQQRGGDTHRFLAGRIMPLGSVNGVLLELAPPRIMDRVAAGDGVALVCASQREDIDGRLVTCPVAAPDAAFPVRAYWADPCPAPPLSRLVAMLRDRQP